MQVSRRGWIFYGEFMLLPVFMENRKMYKELEGNSKIKIERLRTYLDRRTFEKIIKDSKYIHRGNDFNKILSMLVKRNENTR